MSSRLCFATRHQNLAAARTKGFHWGLTTLRRIQRCAGSGFCKPSRSKFCLANVDIVTLASATVQIVITEQVSDSAKIDPLMAVFNAMPLMVTNPWSAQPSVTWIQGH